MSCVTVSLAAADIGCAIAVAVAAAEQVVASVAVEDADIQTNATFAGSAVSSSAVASLFVAHPTEVDGGETAFFIRKPFCVLYLAILLPSVNVTWRS